MVPTAKWYTFLNYYIAAINTSLHSVP